MAANKLIAGVELYSQGARVVLMQPKPVPTVVHCEEILYQAGDEGRVGALIAKLMSRAGVPRANIHMVFTPPQPAAGRQQLFVAPNLSKKEVRLVAARELKRDGSQDVDKTYFTVDTLDEIPSVEGETKGGFWYLITALLAEPVDQIAGSLLASKLVVRSATTSTMGVLRACALTDLPTQGCVAICHLDAKRSSLTVLDNGNPRFFRDIPTTFARGARDGADEALIAQAVAREIDISLVFFAQQHRPKHVENILFVGDPDVADRVIEWLGESQAYNVQRFGPSAKLVVQPNVQAELMAYAPAIGATLASRKARFNSNLLPPQLRGRPERVIGAVVGAVVLALMMIVVAAAYRSAAVRAHREIDRGERMLAAYKSLERQVDTLRKVDQDYANADRWSDFFETVNLYHRRLGNFLYDLQTVMPPRGRLISLAASPAVAPRGRPRPGQVNPTLKLVIMGQIVSSDLQSGQSDVLVTRQKIEQLPSVQSATLEPLTQPRAVSGGLELPFKIDAYLTIPFPAQTPPPARRVRP